MNGVLTLDELPAWRERLRRENLKLVATNGVFDLLHRGHVEYLRRAAALGDRLLVCINSDRAVKELKGPGRPVNAEQDRAFMLAGLRSVDAVAVFDDVRADAALRLASPDVYVKGGDYTEETLDRREHAALRECGARIRFMPFVDGFSTTGILRRLRDNTAAPETASSAAGAAGRTAPSAFPGGCGLIHARRSIRRFQPRAVRNDWIEAILSAGAAAPSARGRCPWHFLAVTDRKTLDALSVALPYGSFLNEAPAAIVVCGDLDQACGRETSYLLQDCAAAMENILLAIQALGLGGCWLGIHPRPERLDAVRKLFSLPDNIVPVGAAALGWPAEEKPPCTKLTEGMIHWERF